MDIDVNGLKERHFSLMVGILKVKENFFFNLLVFCLRNLISGVNDCNLGLFVIIF